MRKAVIVIIVAILAIGAFAFIAHSIWGDGNCIFGDEKAKTECCEKEVKKECCEKEVKKECGEKEVKKSCCDKKDAEEYHANMMETLKPLRAEFDTELNEDEKAVIAEIQKKFVDVDHTEMCPEGKEKFMEEHKADYEALTAIADSHKEYFDTMMEKLHAEKGEGCKHHEGEAKDEGQQHEDGDDVKSAEHSKCPEAEKCKDASEKCKGEKTAEAEKKCEDKEKAKCKEEAEKCEKECLNTFKIHFLLLEF